MKKGKLNNKSLSQSFEVSEEQFKNAFKYSGIGMALVSTDGHWLKVNRRLCDMLGYAKKEFLNKTFQDITHPDDLNLDLHNVSQMLSGEIESYQMEKRYFHKSGSIIWAILNVSLVKGPLGMPLHFVAQIIDITPRKEAQQSLENLRQAVNGILDYAIIVLDENGLVRNWNKGAEKIKGYLAAEIIGKSFEVFYTAEDRKKKKPYALLEEAKQQGQAQATGWRVCKSGATFWANVTITAMHNDMGEVTGFSKVTRDLTEHILAEEAKRNVKAIESKSKEMEQFAYITSHDLREPLLTIKNYVNLFNEDYHEQLDEDARRYIRSITNAANRMETLIGSLLDYSRLSKPKTLEDVNCNTLLEGVESDLHAIIQRKKVRITYKSLPTVRAYPVELQLLFQNLIQNAIKFSKPEVAPEITIATKKIQRGWQFQVKDNGIGIAEKDQERVFIIFRKLHKKDQYEGAGIGLAHVKKITELHHGEVWLESQVGKGTTFYFTLITETL